MRWMLVALAVFLQTSQYPPGYPRPGATKLFENDRVVVWDIGWLKQEYPVHRHVYALAGVYYTSGDRAITNLEGRRREISTEAWGTAFQRAGVTHIEEGTSDSPLRAVFFEMKEDGPSGQRDTATTPPAFPAGHGEQLRDNDRIIAWKYNPPGGAAAAPHRHAYDAVLVWFDGLTPHVSFITHGTVHSDDGIGDTEHAYVFEVK